MPQKRFRPNGNRYRPYDKRPFKRQKNGAPSSDLSRVQAPTAPWGMTPLASIRTAIPIFPSRFRTTLRYHEEGVTATSTSGVPNAYFYSANGCFDPNITGTGHQPLGFDQMMLFFNQCTVVRSKISADIFNDSGGLIWGRTACYVSPDATNLTDPNRIIENGEVDTKIVYNAGTVGSHSTLCNYVDVASYFGRPGDLRGLLQDDTLHTTAAANPSEQVYYAIAMWDPLSTATGIGYFNVTIEYDVYFSEPRKLTES